MATSTAASDRIPLQVSHGGGGGGNANFSSTYEHRTSANSHATSKSSGDAYDLGPLGDETDRIKQRMREFEERCSRWRENFFANRHDDLDVDQRVPLAPERPFVFASNIATHRSPSSRLAAPATTTSTMHHTHRTTVEEAPSGGKKYKIEFEIGDFKQNELQISTHGSSTLVVKGDRELKAGLATETKTFNREITLPDYVDVAHMNAYLVDSNSDNNNVLIVEAPVIMQKYTYR